MLDLVLSTIAFYIAAFYLNRYLNDLEISKGMTRTALVVVLASVAAFGVSSATDWVTNVMDGGHKHVASADPLHSGDLSQLLNTLSGMQGHQ